MELYGKQSPAGIFDSRHGVGRFRDQLETRRKLQRFVPMRHPYFERARQSFEELRVIQQLDLCVAVFAPLRSSHFAAERVRHELQSVADSEHGQAQIKYPR